jgi:hypothetical protein
MVPIVLIVMGFVEFSPLHLQNWSTPAEFWIDITAELVRRRSCSIETAITVKFAVFKDVTQCS